MTERLTQIAILNAEALVLASKFLSIVQKLEKENVNAEKIRVALWQLADGFQKTCEDVQDEIAKAELDKKRAKK